ncbi:MAG: L-threonylcarbamoyladenylate synthase, partial [Planctomycetaceae bacterium]
MPGASGRVAERLSPAQVARAAELLRNGGIGAFPTETVYGLGADLFQPAAIARVFAVKGRPHFDPLIVHLAGPHWLDRVVQSVPPVARELARRFWPGPLTLILPKREEVTELVTAGLPSVGVRVPDHPL